MKTPETHPETELLDKLRAGLLDDTLQREQITNHVRNCESCRQRTDWQGILSSSALATTELEQRLNNARRQALQAPQRSMMARRLAPLAAAASIALVAVLLINPMQQSPTTDSALSVAGQDSPELYEDLDFYLWLTEHSNGDKDSAT